MHYSKIVLGLLFFGTLIFFSNCKEDSFDVTVTGTLYDSCGGAPLANVTLEFGVVGYKSTNIFRKDVPAEKRGTATTDADGRFAFTGHESIGYGYISSEDIRICVGNFSLVNHDTKFEVGDIYTIPSRKKTQYKFYNLKKWQNGESVIATFSQGSTSYRDTFDLTNSSISGGNVLYARGYTYYGTKVIHNGTYANVDTVTVYGQMRYKWSTNKHRGTESHVFNSRVCDKDSITLSILSEL